MKNLSNLIAMEDAAVAIEKLRVSAEVRQSHLALQGRKDEETDKLLVEIKRLEDYVDGRCAELIESHPAYPWFGRVKGVGRENIGKVVAPFNIVIADTISSMWAFAGLDVKDGVAPRRVKGGGKLTYNSQLRSMCWRLGSSLLKAGIRKRCARCKAPKQIEGKCPKCGSNEFESVGNSKFGSYYLKEKDKYIQRCENQGIKIVPATALPTKDGKRYEPKDMISEGHIHNMAQRKMIKLFLSCLWVIWRKAEGLPVTKPYAIDKLGHNSYIDPEEMVDKQQPTKFAAKEAE